MSIAAFVLHIGHAGNDIELALTVAGLLVTVLGVGMTLMALRPRRVRRPGAERPGRPARGRTLHGHERRCDSN